MSRRALLESLFPKLIPTQYEITSEATANYNCIAWAADDNNVWWWPDPYGDYYWPAGVTREESLDAFVAAYGKLGYEPCTSGVLENTFEKVAIFVDAGGAPTHAARQLPSGRWTSKLGRLEDIEHVTLDELCGEAYGKIGIFLRRPR